MENVLKGNENYFELMGGLSYRGFEVPGGDCIYNRRQNELRHFAQNWAFLRFINFQRRKYSFPPLSPPCNVVPLF